MKTFNEFINEASKYQNWDKDSIIEFLEIIGQDNFKFKTKDSGISSGDFGKVDFSLVKKIPYIGGNIPALLLTFDDDDKTVEMYQIKISRQVSNPYEINYFPQEEPQNIYIAIEE